METGQSYLEVYCAVEMRSHYWTALVAVLDITIAAVIPKLPVLSVQMVSKICPTSCLIYCVWPLWKTYAY